MHIAYAFSTLNFSQDTQKKNAILIYSSARFPIFAFESYVCLFQRSNRKAPLELKEFETTP